ncbi:MAG: alpha-L-fucosidase [Saccharofermentanales bacterium]
MINDKMNWFLSSKFGIYVTWSYEAPLGACGCYPDGSLPKTFDEMTEAFDVVRFADDCALFGVQYVNFTAYHAHMNVLFPSSVLNRRIPGHTSAKDVIRELIDELHRRGIRLQLYIHATIGDSMTEEEREVLGWHDAADGYRKWNDFINEFFDELCSRYGTEIDSYYIDMIFHEPFLERIDRPRLIRTLTKYHPEVVVVGNGQATDGVHYGSREDAMVEYTDSDDRPAYPTQTVVCLTGKWWSTYPDNLPDVTRYTPEHLFRYLVLTASSNTEGGGLAIGTSPYVTTGYEPGVREAMIGLGRLIRPVSESILDTVPSKAYVTPAGMQIRNLAYGFVATRSIDGTKEYIHVLNAPDDNSAVLPVPLDGSRYTSARMLRTGSAVALLQNETGISLLIPDSWDPLDTVIELTRESSAAARPAQSRILPNEDIRVTGSGFRHGHAPEYILDGDPMTFWCSAEGITHSLTLDLGQEYDVCALRVLPRQERSVESLVTQVTSYSVWAGTDIDALRPISTGEWKRTFDEKRAAFSAIHARYIRLEAGPEWLPPDWRVYPRSAAAVSCVAVEVV